LSRVRGGEEWFCEGAVRVRKREKWIEVYIW